MENIDIQGIIRDTVREFRKWGTTPEEREVAYKDELREEVKRRETLERRLNELVAQNRIAREAAAKVELSATVRSELRRQGCRDVDLYGPAVERGVYRNENTGRIVSQDGHSLAEFVTAFLRRHREVQLWTR